MVHQQNPRSKLGSTSCGKTSGMHLLVLMVFSLQGKPPSWVWILRKVIVTPYFQVWKASTFSFLHYSLLIQHFHCLSCFWAPMSSSNAGTFHHFENRNGSAKSKEWLCPLEWHQRQSFMAVLSREWVAMLIWATAHLTNQTIWASSEQLWNVSFPIMAHNTTYVNTLCPWFHYHFVPSDTSCVVLLDVGLQLCPCCSPAPCPLHVSLVPVIWA